MGAVHGGRGDRVNTGHDNSERIRVMATRSVSEIPEVERAFQQDLRIELLPVSDVEAVIDTVDDARPDVIVLGESLEPGSGKKLARHLAALDQTPALVMVVGGDDEVSVLEEAQAAGVTAFVARGAGGHVVDTVARVAANLGSRG